VHDLRGTPPISVSPPVNLTRPMMGGQFGGPGQVMAQQQPYIQGRMMGQPQTVQPGFMQQFPVQQVRPNMVMPQGRIY